MSKFSESYDDGPSSLSRQTSRAALGRKSSFGGGFKGMEDGPQLPLCPKGQNVDYSAIGPCRKRRSKSKAKMSKRRRKTAFRVPLKKEDGNMESQIVEYNCEFPNRVVVRMEYLMQSTKVRLNDRHYMDDFYLKLLEEERRSLEKATKSREKAELNRMKKLIIDGIYYDIPPELNYLHRHPVFRVNKMLARIQSYDHELQTKVEEEDEITPVEPYEFNGNMFFKHLHEEGTVWMPPEFHQYEKEKLAGKIYRAKLRLLMKRKEQESEEKALRLIGEMQGSEATKTEEPEPEPETSSKRKSSRKKSRSRHQSTVRLLLEQEAKEQDNEDELLSSALHMETQSKPMSTTSVAASRIRAKSRVELHALEERIKRSKEEQEKRDKELDQKRHELDIHFVDTYDYDYHRIKERHRERERQRNVEDLFEKDFNPEQKHKELSAKASIRASKRNIKKMKPYEDMFEKKVDSQIKLTGHSQKDLFAKLKLYYEVPKKHAFHLDEPYKEDLVDEIEEYEGGEEMMDYATEVVEMFHREELTAKEYLAKCRQRLYEKEPEPKRKSSAKEDNSKERKMSKKRTSDGGGSLRSSRAGSYDPSVSISNFDWS